ncbi:MAG: hypothetical protein A2Z34_02405 [Planctomycetes bacterium RBG_16_59_8]|nr:MAG: hypothetical protein A2Z34_02405 [Planctomycetes bacterium RBG_16_59_8]
MDTEGFEKALERQRLAARRQTKIASEIFASGPLQELRKKIPPTLFTGYKELASPMTVLALVRGKDTVERIERGEEATVLCDCSPFYGESGGQVGDTGDFSAEGVRFLVENTTRLEGYLLHHGKVEEGALKLQQRVK